MKRLIPAGILAAAVVAASAGAGLAPSVHAQVPPARFYGQATMGDQPAPAGTEVRAYIGETECGMGTVNEEGRYVVDVKTKAEDAPNCGEEGSIVTFTLAGQGVGQTGEFQTGYFLELNLSLDAPMEPPPAPPSEEPQPEQPQPEQPQPEQPQPEPGEGEGGGEQMPSE